MEQDNHNNQHQNIEENNDQENNNNNLERNNNNPIPENNEAAKKLTRKRSRNQRSCGKAGSLCWGSSFESDRPVQTSTHNATALCM